MTIKTPNKVKIRKRKTSDRIFTLHLDYSINGKRIRESLDLKIFEPALTQSEKTHNKETTLKADYLRNERENQFFKDEIDEQLHYNKRKGSDFYDFIQEYLSEYQLRDVRMIKASLRAFAAYAPPPLSSREITEELCQGFKEYLDNNYFGETPSSYFARFKKVIRIAYKRKVIRFNPVEDIINFRNEDSIQKDTLSSRELQMLASVKCPNEMVKKAFLFACNTGLRYCDVKTLKWRDIKAETLKISQNKTDKAVEIPLNVNAKGFLPERSEQVENEEFVYKLPSENGTNKALKIWASKAGLEKHVTFHCARHTFGTLLGENGCDVALISKLLGHSSLRHTMKYVRVGIESKKKAVELLPVLK